MSTDLTFLQPDIPVSNNGIISSNSTVNKDTTFQMNPPLTMDFGLDDSLSAANRRPLTTDDSDNDSYRVSSRRNPRRKHKNSNNTQSTRKFPSSAVDISQPVASLAPVIVSQNVDNIAAVDSSSNAAALTNLNQNLNLGPTTTSSSSSVPIAITKESARFAQTRYPFPPFILRFNSGKVSVNQVQEVLIAHGQNVFQTEVHILNCRLFKHGDGIGFYDIYIYVKDALSFSFLLEESHWPDSFEKEKFLFPSVPAIPPQLCLIVKNVDLNIDFQDFCSDVKVKYPQVKNIIRMKNKFQNDIRLVKLELTSSVVRDDLLNGKRLLVNYISYDIAEYLAPVNVLICSKCLGIGHFKKQCSQTKETCRTCGDMVNDLKNHVCSKVEKCIHCNQNHKSNSLKCPVIKSYRAELTKKLLHSNHEPPAIVNRNFGFNSVPSVAPPGNLRSMSSVVSSNPVIDKLNDLIIKLSDIQNKLVALEVKYDKFEQFMISKNQSDENIQVVLTNLSTNHENLKTDVVQHSILIDRHEDIFSKLMFPLLDDICSFISAQNTTKNRPIDADLKCRLEHYHLQMKKALDGKRFHI